MGKMSTDFPTQRVSMKFKRWSSGFSLFPNKLKLELQQKRTVCYQAVRSQS
jgi:hypothetical protein